MAAHQSPWKASSKRVALPPGFVVAGGRPNVNMPVTESHKLNTANPVKFHSIIVMNSFVDKNEQLHSERSLCVCIIILSFGEHSGFAMTDTSQFSPTRLSVPHS